MLEINTFKNSYTELMNKHQSLFKSLSKVDKDINNLYHALELLDVDAIDIVKIGKMLRSNLKLRREIKAEMSMIDTIKSSPQKNINEVLQNFTDRMKNNRTEAMSIYKLHRKQNV